MRPSFQSLTIAVALFLLALGGAFFPSGQVLFWGAVVLFLFLLALDAILFGLQGKVRLERDWPARFALKEDTEIRYFLQNEGRFPLQVRFFDSLPEECSYQFLPFALPKLKAGGQARASYRVTFLQRGDLPVAPGFLEVRSFFGFWWCSRRVGGAVTARVYPNYVPALNYGLLATADRAEMMGIVKPRRKGLSKEFHQLRDYHEGDSLSQVDWKATARFNRLITREYQEERDQTILLVPDCSLRTRAIDGELPLLDHLLNAAILLAYIALGQGDKVGVMSFGGPERHLTPVKGNHGMAQILDHLYNYQPTRDYGDYGELVTRVLRTQHKRCLIIVLTNLRSEDQFGSLGALQLLTRQHLVMLASLRETVVESALTEPLATSADADRYLGALAYEEDISRLVTEARGRGFSALHESLDHYPIALANQFLDLRASGRF